MTAPRSPDHVRSLVDAALEHSPIVHITTTGRRSGLLRRIEIWMFRVEGRYIITGTPGRRDWYANVMGDGRLSVHLPRLGLDLDGTAVPVVDEQFRRNLFTSPAVSWYSTQAELEALVAEAPMVEISFG